MKATDKKTSRIGRSNAGRWYREQEHFPGSFHSVEQQWEVPCRRRHFPAIEDKAESSSVAFSLTELERHVKEVFSSLSAEWERKRHEQQCRAAYDILSQLIGETTRLFGEDVSIYQSCDPEFPEDNNIVFRVESTLSSAEALRAECEWAKAINKIAPKADLFNLVVYRKQ